MGCCCGPTPNEIAMLASEGPLGRAVERIASELNDGTLDSRVAGAALQLYYEQVHA